MPNTVTDVMDNAKNVVKNTANATEIGREIFGTDIEKKRNTLSVTDERGITKISLNPVTEAQSLRDSIRETNKVKTVKINRPNDKK